MRKTQDRAPVSPVSPAATPQADRTTGSRARTPRDPPSHGPVDPVAEEMRAHAVTAVTSSPTALADFDGKDVLTLEDLIARHGQATVGEVEYQLGDAPAEELVDDGRAVATPRITRDGARIWGTVSAFLQRATTAQRALIPGVTDEFVRIAIWSTYQGQLSYAMHKNASATITTERTGRNANSEDLRRRCGERRDVLYSGLRIIVGVKGELRSRVEQVYRKNMQPDVLSFTTRALVRLGREALADTSPAATQRRRGSLITAEFLTESEALAKEVEAIGKEVAAAPSPPPVSQSDVDLWDGRNLAFLELVIDAFETAHIIDPNIPRLPPVSLRNVLGPRRRPKKDESPSDEPSTPPSTPPPTPPRQPVTGTSPPRSPETGASPPITPSTLPTPPA